MSPEKITYDIKRKSYDLGFSLVGISPAEKLTIEEDYFNRWLNLHYSADMNWLSKNKSKRTNPSEILVGAKSIICLGVNYFSEPNYNFSFKNGKISRYAIIQDYHTILSKKIQILIEYIKSIRPECNSIFYVDTGPILEKAYAQKAGLGWIGKNTNLINKNIGSWFFLGLIITDLDLIFDKAGKNFCGSCNNCIESCPTGALIEPYILDSKKCISYITIEFRGKTIPDFFKNKMNGWIFGCDICQEVCPWNKFSRQTEIEDFKQKIDHQPNLKSIIDLDEVEFKNRYQDTPVKRGKLEGLKRNAAFILTEKG